MNEDKNGSLDNGEALVKDEQTNKKSGRSAEDTEEIPKAYSLSEALDLEDMMYDSDAFPEDNGEGSEQIDNESYELLLSDYKDTIAKAFALSSEEKASEKNEEDEEDEIPALVKHKELSGEEKGRHDEQKEPSDLLSAIISDRSSKEDTSEQEGASEADEADEEPSEAEQLEIDLGAIAEEKPVQEDAAPSETEDGKEETKKGKWIHSFFEIVELFVFTLVVVMILTNFVFRHSEVEGGSMMNTLHDGDHLIISDLFYTPDYGDIVVFTSEKTGDQALVKRVVALEGDVVDFYYGNGNSETGYKLYVNGKLVEEDYTYFGGSEHVNKDVVGYKVGEGEVFVLGDHRNNSHDSRAFGAIDVDCILGRVILRFYPFSDFGFVD